jgi:alkanesulfonate monooxygenase SsuD/methylene tetrahydromethanopterin reductase-like flavin-dependent oxidoreductase (luciferase family)
VTDVDIGIGFPNQVPGAGGGALVRFARRADALGFSTLGTLGRVAYPGHDDLIALATAAAATERIRLMTNILLLPTHDPVLLAKQAASVDLLSGGRLTLGVAVGGRQDDYAAVGRSFTDRGRRMDRTIELMRSVWRGEPVPGADRALVPAMPAGRIPLVFGGTSDRTIDRVVRCGVGWTSGGGGPTRALPFIERLRDAWRSAEREGEPRLTALAYVALGDDAERGLTKLRDYYAFAGPYAEAVASSALTTPDAVRQAIEKNRESGFDELILVSTIADPAQADMLRAATSST